jgi:hypothetical protein
VVSRDKSRFRTRKFERRGCGKATHGLKRS